MNPWLYLLIIVWSFISCFTVTAIVSLYRECNFDFRNPYEVFWGLASVICAPVLLAALCCNAIYEDQRQYAVEREEREQSRDRWARVWPVVGCRRLSEFLLETAWGIRDANRDPDQHITFDRPGGVIEVDGKLKVAVDLGTCCLQGLFTYRFTQADYLGLGPRPSIFDVRERQIQVLRRKCGYQDTTLRLRVVAETMVCIGDPHMLVGLSHLLTFLAPSDATWDLEQTYYSDRSEELLPSEMSSRLTCEDHRRAALRHFLRQKHPGVIFNSGSILPLRNPRTTYLQDGRIAEPWIRRVERLAYRLQDIGW